MLPPPLVDDKPKYRPRDQNFGDKNEMYQESIGCQRYLFSCVRLSVLFIHVCQVLPELLFFFSAALFTAKTFQPLPFHCFCLTLVSGKTRFGRKEKDFCLLTSLSRRGLLVKCLEWAKLKYVTQVAFGLDCNPWG